MNTAQLLLSKGAATQQVKSVAPWLIGGLVVALALIILWKL
jgi:hypothetical protein